MHKLYTETSQSCIGEFSAIASESELISISLPGHTLDALKDRIEKYYSNVEYLKSNMVLNDFFEQLDLYLTGKLHSFTVPFNINGTEFQKKALKAVSQIPYGETKSYGQIAEQIGSPKAVRAVGTANKTNILPLLIPCHRVVASNGLGGYAGGLDMKKKLLAIEQKNNFTL